MRLNKADLTIVIDTREKEPLTFLNAKVESGTLDAGDYSLRKWENQIAIERKSLSDLLCSLGVERKRFFREIHRLKGLEYSAIVIEASLNDLYSGQWRSKITPESVIGSLEAISVKYGIHIFWAENRENAGNLVEGLLYHFLRAKLQEHEKLKPYFEKEKVG